MPWSMIFEVGLMLLGVILQRAKFSAEQKKAFVEFIEKYDKAKGSQPSELRKSYHRQVERLKDAIQNRS